jgi:uncharacterized protein YodC (DUF2158 family)
MNDAAGDELVFVPQVGFRLAHGGLQSENVVVKRGGETLIAGLTSDRDGTDPSGGSSCRWYASRSAHSVTHLSQKAERAPRFPALIASTSPRSRKPSKLKTLP